MALEKSSVGRMVRDHGPVAFFVLVTLGGMAFIWTFKLYGFASMITIIVPIALMLSYFAVSLFANGMRLHNEQAGDNLYYMGFLFTLTSLGVTLYQFSGESSIQDIVQNFGVAISSTIMGITLRIFFNQMRRDPIDIERNVRHELAEMTRRVRTELDTSAREFASYRRVSNQMLSEGFEEIARQAEKNGLLIQQAIESLSKDAVKPIQEAAEKMTAILAANHEEIQSRSIAGNAAVEAATARFATTTVQVNETVEQLGVTVENLRKKLDELKSPGQSINMKLQPALSSIQKSVEAQISTMDAHLELSRAQAEMVTNAVEPLSEVASSLKSSANMMDQAATSNIETNEAIQLLLKRLDERSIRPDVTRITPEIRDTAPPSVGQTTDLPAQDGNESIAAAPDDQAKESEPIAERPSSRFGRFFGS